MIGECPEYRLRLFLSADLVGSTAYKTAFGDNYGAESSPNPAWVDEIRRFYREFPVTLNRAYDKVEALEPLNPTASPPKVWKTIGDEIAFCCRLTCQNHLARCVKAFVLALRDYGEYLDSQEHTLDIKGYGWVAAFPSPNVTVRVMDPNGSDVDMSSSEPELSDEAFEIGADCDPSRYDFLGREIDAGFRAGAYCAEDKFSMSVELAWFISGLKDSAPLDNLVYVYQGRELMKGILNERPYPIVCIDVERSASRKMVRHRERKISVGLDGPSPIDIHDFLTSFIEDERIERPSLPKSSVSGPPTLPQRYQKFRTRWEPIAQELRRRQGAEQDAAEQDGSDTAQKLDDSITEAAELTVELVNRTQPDE